MIIKEFLLLLNGLCLCCGAKILGIFPSSGYSQFILGETLMKELAHRGHDVTVISPYRQQTKIKNYRDISVGGLVDLLKNEDLFLLYGKSVIENIITTHDLGLLLTEFTLKDLQVQNLLRSNETFDLVLTEQFFNEAHMGFAYRFKAPFILFSSIGSSEWSNNLVGNAAPLSHVPNTFLGFTCRMCFYQRLTNTFVNLFDILYKKFMVFPKQNALLKKYIPNTPKLETIIYNTSLVLLNSHVSTNEPVPRVPAMIEIGGFHIRPKKLPQHLQTILDNAKDGVILFSMGSNLKSSNFPEEKRIAFLKVFSKLKQKVLWKWEENSLPGQPENVILSKWLPQQDVLSHRNVKVFISHGGLLSTIETTYYGVPVIGIPVFGDQKMNVATMEYNGFALSLKFSDITEEILNWALNETLNNPKYKQNALQRSKLMLDQPVKPLDNAMFWIDYVIRHKGAVHYRAASLDLEFYQLALLDVTVFLFACSIITIVLCNYIIKRLSRIIHVPSKMKLKKQ